MNIDKQGFDRLAETLAAHIDNLQKVAYTWSEDIDAMYEAYEARILAAIEEAYERYSLTNAMTYSRLKTLKTLKARLLAIRDDCYEEIIEYVEENAKRLVENESKFHLAWIFLLYQLANMRKPKVLSLTQENMESIRKYGVYNGVVLNDIYTKIMNATIDRIYSKFSYSTTFGRTLAELKQDIGKEFDIAKRQLSINTIGVVNGLSNDTSIILTQRNPEVVYGVMWITALDDKVCDDCARHEGVVYFDGNEPPCPMHVNCRCHLIPVSKELTNGLEEAREDLD